MSSAQDEVSSDVDVESLIDETLPTPSTETKIEPVEPISSETVDLEKLEADLPAEEPAVEAKTPEETTVSTQDELETLKQDLGNGEFIPATEVEATKTIADEKPAKKEEKKEDVIVQKVDDEPKTFDVGAEERELLSMAQNIQGQMTDSEWSELATSAKVDSYKVVSGDWLFKISKKIFGSGYYYPKIWALNAYITNPHLIEPGMILSFTTGNSLTAPEVKIGTFDKDELAALPGARSNENATDLRNFGDDINPEWVGEKSKLEKQGVYFQYASDETMDDLVKAGAQSLNKEYENYDPPSNKLETIVPPTVDKFGFDKTSRIFYSFKQGFYLSTFISTNIVQDFGSITDGPNENIIFVNGDHAYVKFDENLNPSVGDKFSIYSPEGKVKHKSSDREGYKYTIVGHVKLINKIKDKWEVEFTQIAGEPQRGDRITSYTPKIERITKTYSSRIIEAGIIDSYKTAQTVFGVNDVVYLDRGRADGVELGNVFDVYGFKDRLTDKNITNQPTYKVGELTVITLTDNFATAIVSDAKRDFTVGDIAITKSKEAYLREKNSKITKKASERDALGNRQLEELDVELNLDDLNEDLLKEADKIQLSEDELAELERQEREKSVLRDSERDLKSLERLESEIEQAEKILNDAKLDEDKLLEEENLNDVEKKNASVDQESLDEIEQNLGKRYIDEDLNTKENPFGLTEFDVEEVDELLNIEKKTEK